MSALTFWDFLTLSTEALIARGINPRDVVDRRFAATGHVRPIGQRWLPTFGGWGSVLGVDELADRVGTERHVVIDYAKAKGLRLATRERRWTHAELAIRLWCDRNSSPEASCLRFGVYPGERRILCAAAQVLVDRTDLGFARILGWSRPHLDAQFAELGVNIHPPASILGRVSMEATR